MHPGGFITPTATACEVLILQHSLEAQYAGISARLLHLRPSPAPAGDWRGVDDAALCRR